MLLDLPAEIILKIFAFNDLHEMFSLSLVCKRFRELILNSFPCDELDISYRLLSRFGPDINDQRLMVPSCFTNLICQKSGSVLRSIIARGNSEFVNVILLNCQPMCFLLALDISSSRFLRISEIARWISKCFNLSVLKLSGCTDVDDTFLEVVSGSIGGQLLLLDVSFCPRISGNGLYQVVLNGRNLQALRIHNCQALRTGKLFLREVLSLPNIRDLNIGNWHYRFEIPQVIVMDSLEALSASGCLLSIRNGSLQTKSLKKLVLSYCTLLTDSEMIILLAGTGRTLRSLDISNCPLITNETLFALTRMADGLTSLNLSDCPHVTDAGVSALFGNLKNWMYMALDGCDRLSDLCLTFYQRHQSKTQKRHLDLFDVPKISLEMIETLISLDPNLEIRNSRLIMKRMETQNHHLFLRPLSICNLQ